MKPVKIVTPKGTAIWPKLNEPDRKFSPEGIYSVKLRIADGEAAGLIEKISEIHAEGYRIELAKSGKKSIRQAPMPWRSAQDWDKEREENVDVPGFTDFIFKMKAKVVTSTKSWEQRPALFDAKLHPIPADADPIGGGSTIRISAEPYVWFSASLGYGISLRPRSVQVLELRTYAASGNHGFSEEDGFTVGTDEAMSPDF